MANETLAELSAASTPLSGNELLYGTQLGGDVKILVSDITGGGGGGSPAGGVDTSVQYNASSVLTGDSNLTWDYTDQILSVGVFQSGGEVQVDNITSFSAATGSGNSGDNLAMQGGQADVEVTGGAGGSVLISGGTGEGGGGGGIVLEGGADTISGGTGGSITLTPGFNLDSVYANVIITNLPTSDPSVAGALYNSSGTLKISAG